MKLIASILLSVAFLTAGNSFGKDVPQANSFNEALAAVPAAELPAKAADLILHARSRERQATTVSVVKSAVAMNPAAAPAIVGAIARAVPDMASVAAGAAAALQPKQAAAIAKAAAAAAPSKAGKIVTAVCRAVPNEYRNIAAAVAQVVPGAGKEIVNAVASALPGLKPAIDSVLAGYGGNVVSVVDTIDAAAKVSPASLTPVPAVSPTGPTVLPLLAPSSPRGPDGQRACGRASLPIVDEHADQCHARHVGRGTSWRAELRRTLAAVMVGAGNTLTQFSFAAFDLPRLCRGWADRPCGSINTRNIQRLPVGPA